VRDLLPAAAFAVLGAALTAYLATPAVAALARGLGVLDRPGGRKAHAGAVPRLGGAALFAGLLLGCSAYALAFGPERLRRLVAGESFLLLLAPAGFVFLVGVLDDVRGLGPAPRVVAEVLAAGVLVQAGYLLDRVATPFAADLHLGFLAVPLTLLWFVGVTNAYNLVDGLDGLMATLAIPALGGIAAVAFLQGQNGTGILALSLCGALLGFLRWNWHPARIFLGDSGSLLVGFAVAALSLRVARSPAGSLNLQVPLALSAVPITETFLTLARRYVSGKPYFSGDRSHIHHVLVRSGLTVPRTVLSLGVVAALSAAVAVLSLSWRETGSMALIAVLLAAIALGLRRLGYVEVRVLLDRLRSALLRPRRPGLADLAQVALAGDRVRGATCPGALRDGLRAAVGVGGFSYIALEFRRDAALSLGLDGSVVEARNPDAEAWLAASNGAPKWLFSADPPPDPGARESSCLAFPIPAGDGRIGRLVCHRHLAPGSPAPPSPDVRRYLADPVAETLLSLERRASPRPRTSP
jgi:UDP-GlcNAc:undecaprenyl-phosphate GlcNAc-1-phosphate transferase